jgi:hypothetical protein
LSQSDFNGRLIKGMDMKKINSLIYLSFLVIFLLAGCVNSSSNLVTSEDDYGWVKYDDNDEGIYSYKNVNIDKDVIQVWNKKVFSDEGRKKFIQDMTKNGKTFDKLSEGRDLIEIDCKNLRKRTVSTTLYDQNKVIFFQYYDEEWSSIIPNSHGETILKEVCK